MKVGDLVRLKTSKPSLGIFEGDLGILTEIDWDKRDYPAGISNGETVITGRGYFLFPSRPQTHSEYSYKNSLGIMLLYNDFELLDDDHVENHK